MSLTIWQKAGHSRIIIFFCMVWDIRTMLASTNLKNRKVWWDRKRRPVKYLLFECGEVHIEVVQGGVLCPVLLVVLVQLVHHLCQAGVCPPHPSSLNHLKETYFSKDTLVFLLPWESGQYWHGCSQGSWTCWTRSPPGWSYPWPACTQ